MCRVAGCRGGAFCPESVEFPVTRFDALKEQLEDLDRLCRTPDFVAHDPLRFPHRFRQTPLAAEMVGFMAAMFGFGQRPMILKTVERLLAPMGADPLAYVQAFTPSRGQNDYAGFVYRFYKTEDVVWLLGNLQRVYGDYGSLEAVLAAQPREWPLRDRLAGFMDALAGRESRLLSYGSRFMLPHPARGGACKRLHMFLRWMVRDDGIDLGLWREALRPSDLLIPVDTHVARNARLLGLTRRKADDWRTAEEITEVLRQLDPEDPVRYDFALFLPTVRGGNAKIGEAD